MGQLLILEIIARVLFNRKNNMDFIEIIFVYFVSFARLIVRIFRDSIDMLRVRVIEKNLFVISYRNIDRIQFAIITNCYYSTKIKKLKGY